MTIETKLQIEALKMLDKGENKPRYAKNGECFFLSLNGTYAFCICDEPFRLNPEILEEMPSLAQFFSPDKLLGTSELTVTNEMRKLTHAVGVLVKCDDFTTCIDEKLLKMFMDRSCRLYAEDENSTIYFVHNDKIYAAVMPICLEK